MVQNDSNSYIILLHGAVCDGQHNNVLYENYSVFYNNKVVASGAILVVFIRLVDSLKKFPLCITIINRFNATNIVNMLKKIILAGKKLKCQN